MAAVSVFPSQGELGAALARLVTEAAAEAVASRGRFTLGLSGGSLVALLARELPPALSAAAGAEPSRWLVAFCDERLVPPEHPESTGGAYRVRGERAARREGSLGLHQFLPVWPSSPPQFLLFPSQFLPVPLSSSQSPPHGVCRPFSVPVTVQSFPVLPVKLCPIPSPPQCSQ